MSIGYSGSTQFCTQASAWWCVHEKDARVPYALEMTHGHPNFSALASGLDNPVWPFLGVSPEGIMNSNCCGMGVLEIKYAPYEQKGLSWAPARSLLRTLSEQWRLWTQPDTVPSNVKYRHKLNRIVQFKVHT